MAQGKKDASAQAESAAEAAKALAAAERRLEAAAAAKSDLEQRIAETKQQLAPFEGRVQAAIAETKVGAGPAATLTITLCASLKLAEALKGQREWREQPPWVSGRSA